MLGYCIASNLFKKKGRKTKDEVLSLVRADVLSGKLIGVIIIEDATSNLPQYILDIKYYVYML